MRRIGLGRYGKLTRSQILLTIASIAAVALMIIVVWDIFAWRSYVANSHQGYDNAKQLTYRVLKSAKGSSELGDLSSELASESAEVCRAPLTAELRAYLRKEYKDQLEWCAQRQEALLAASQAVSKLADELHSERLVVQMAEDLAGGMAKIRRSDYAAMRSEWRKAYDRLPPVLDESSTAVTAKVKPLVGTVVDKYDQLALAAQESEDRSKFDDAVVELGRAHDELIKVASEYRDNYKLLVDDMHLAVAAL